MEGRGKVVFMSPSTMKTTEIRAFINMVEGVEGKKPYLLYFLDFSIICST